MFIFIFIENVWVLEKLPSKVGMTFDWDLSIAHNFPDTDLSLHQIFSKLVYAFRQFLYISFLILRKS